MSRCVVISSGWLAGFNEKPDRPKDLSKPLRLRTPAERMQYERELKEYNKRIQPQCSKDMIK